MQDKQEKEPDPNEELDPLDDDYDEKRLQGYGQQPRSENKLRDFDSRRDLGKFVNVCDSCYDLPPDQICRKCQDARTDMEETKKIPDAYGIRVDGKITHVTLEKQSAEYWVSKGPGREIVPLYDHPSKEVIRQFAAWLREGDSNESTD